MTTARRAAGDGGGVDSTLLSCGDAAARAIPVLVIAVKAYIRSAATGVISFSASDTMRAASSSCGKISSTRSVTR